ncbi:MAG: hypothetical protein R3C29_14690 [Dehalococcoidia bacterium]
MRSLSGTLTAAQKAATRTPAITAVLWNRPQTPNNPRRLRWTRYYDGAENDDPIAAAIATDGSLVRIRANGTTIEHNRVASPGSGSTYSTWTTLASSPDRRTRRSRSRPLRRTDRTLDQDLGHRTRLRR